MAALPVGQALPDLSFAPPFAPGEAGMLGVAKDKPFSLKNIKGDVLVLVVFSMYCPYCQREAPELSRFHELVKQRGLSGKLALVGLGAGNSAFEVDVYRQKLAAPFPLLPDPDFARYKLLGQVGTPYYYVAKRQGGSFVIVDTLLGCMASAEAFLDTVTAKTGLGKGK